MVDITSRVMMSRMPKIETSRRLRRNSTEVEKLLWSRLRDRQLDYTKFRRQHPLGPYVVDFFCLKQGLVIELDGGQHAVQAEDDRRRDRWMKGHGYQVLRFWNHEVMSNIEGVLQRISENLDHMDKAGS